MFSDVLSARRLYLVFTSIVSQDSHASTEIVPALCVLSPKALLRVLDPHLNGYAHHKRLQQPMTSTSSPVKTDRTTATAPAPDLVLAVRKCRLRYTLGHVLRLSADRMVRRSLMALLKRGTHYPGGSLLSDCEGVAFQQLRALASNRPFVAPKWRDIPVSNVYSILSCHSVES